MYKIKLRPRLGSKYDTAGDTSTAAEAPAQAPDKQKEIREYVERLMSRLNVDSDEEALLAVFLPDPRTKKSKSNLKKGKQKIDLPLSKHRTDYPALEPAITEAKFKLNCCYWKLNREYNFEPESDESDSDRDSDNDSTSDDEDDVEVKVAKETDIVDKGVVVDGDSPPPEKQNLGNRKRNFLQLPTRRSARQKKQKQELASSLLTQKGKDKNTNAGKSAKTRRQEARPTKKSASTKSDSTKKMVAKAKTGASRNDSVTQKSGTNRRGVRTRPGSVSCVKDRTVRAKFRVSAQHVSGLQFCNTFADKQKRDFWPKSQHFMYTYDEMVEKPHYSDLPRRVDPLHALLVPDKGFNKKELGKRLIELGKAMMGQSCKTNYICTTDRKEYENLVFGPMLAKGKTTTKKKKTTKKKSNKTKG